MLLEQEELVSAVLLALVNIIPIDSYMHIYCYCMISKSECVFTCAHDYIYSDSAL